MDFSGKHTGYISKIFLTLCASFFLASSSFAQKHKLEHFQEPNASVQNRCLPSQACWPDQKQWNLLAKKLTGRLVKPQAALAVCHEDPNSKDCQATLKNVHNPFYLQSKPSETQSQGWYKAWTAQVSEYAVEAKTTEDVVAAVNFARKHNLRLAIKGGGHDYFGRSNAANSLLIWTHPMRGVVMHDGFIPTGCLHSQKAVPAITVQAGTRWIDAYNEVTTKHSRYVQGGGCTTVGVAGGFTQGGGFGAFSKKYGTGAANIVEVEIVSAQGKVLIANECQNEDIFWAVRGGGGGTFGVVTKMTLQTFDLPSNFGIYKAKITTKNDDNYKKLIKQFISFYRENINNEHWGEQIAFNKNNTIDIFMVFQGLTKNQVQNSWEPLNQWIKKSGNTYIFENKISIIPSDKMWDYNFWKENHPDLVVLNMSEGVSSQFWWKPNSGEASKYWYTYLSRWLPLSMFSDDNVDKLSQTLFMASRFAPITLHVNKGLAGAAKDAIQRTKRTATNPAVFEAAALVIIAAGSNDVFPSVKGKEINETTVSQIVKNYQEAFQLIKDISPNAGTYVNEADYFEKDWQTSFWGDNYKRLYSIKQKYDPNNLFYCHHCVGSESCDASGNCAHGE